jgi:hypothetical protein
MVAASASSISSSFVVIGRLVKAEGPAFLSFTQAGSIAAPVEMMKSCLIAVRLFICICKKINLTRFTGNYKSQQNRSMLSK